MNKSTPKIPENIKRKFPELAELISTAQSMTEEERYYWLRILPIMDDDQIHDLTKILTEEKDSLAQIDASYSAQKAQLDELEASLSKQERLSSKIKQLREEEAQSEEREDIEQEKILNELNE